jgi:hypothetical protein
MSRFRSVTFTKCRYTEAQQLCFMKFFFQICFKSQNLHLFSTCKLKNRFQIKYQKVIVHTVVGDSE